MTRLVSTLTLAAACALLVPAWAGASIVQVTDSGQLRVDGQPGETNRVELRYRTAAEAGFGGLGDRILVEDSAGAVPPPALPVIPPPPIPTEPCVAITAETVSCDARLIGSIAAALGDGNDVMVINAGAADPIPAAYRVKVSGGAGNDVIRGGAGRDAIAGNAGDDIVAGWTGDDALAGGAGSDGVLGFSGDDRLAGGSGPDALFAQKGRDRMRGGKGNDVLIARDGFRDPLIDCGPGSGQRATVDRRDPAPRRCKALEPKKRR